MHPLEEIAKARQSAAQIWGMRERMNLSASVTDLQDRLGEAEQAQQDVSDHLGFGEDSEFLVPVDDGIPPAAPTGLTVTPVPYKELDATWAAPPDTDQVVSSVMEITPTGGSAKTYTGFETYAYATGLAGGVVHSVRVKFVDRWGHESAYSAAVNATPMLTAAEQIDLDALQILGRLQGLLPNANLATLTDATKLGSGVVTAAAMAVQDAVAINLWVQNAAIQSAKISTLVADKITTGTMSAATITLSGSGQLVAGSTTFGASGITLGATTTLAAIPSASQSINNSGTAFSSVHFFTELGVSGTRGLVLRSDGDSTSRGQTSLYGLRTLNGNPYDGNNSAFVDVKGTQLNFGAETAAVAVGPYLDVQKSGATFAKAGGITANGPVVFTGSLTADSWSVGYASALFSVGPGGTRTWTHSWGQWPIFIFAFEDRGDGTRKPLPGSGDQLRIETFSVNSVTFQNFTAGTTITVGFYANKRL